jgi:hypothetical protein
MTIANVALTHTFDTWRMRTNDAIVAVNGLRDGTGFANVASLKIQSAGTTGQYLKLLDGSSGATGWGTPPNAFTELTGTIAGNQFPATITVAANTTLSGNLTLSGTTKTLGSIASVKITGGSSTNVITTDGAGNLSFSSKTPSANTVTWSMFANPGVYSADGTLGSNSDVLFATQKAVRTYVTTVASGLLSNAAYAVGTTNLANNSVTTAKLASNLSLGGTTVATGLSVTGNLTTVQIKETKTSPSISSGVMNIDLSVGTLFNPTLNQNVTSLTFSNVPASGTAACITLFLTQDGTGSRTVAWPGAVAWGQSGAPTLTTTASKTDIITLVTFNGGTTWFGAIVGKGY